VTRTRFLKPGFFLNEQLAALPFEGRLLFAGLWLLADREGRLEDRPLRIKAEVFPFDAVDVELMLSQLALKGFVLRYTVEAVRVIQVLQFAKHQHPHPRESLSVLPKPCKGTAKPRKGMALDSPRLPDPNSNSNSDPLPSEESREAADAVSPPPLLTFPCVGQGAKVWPLGAAQVQSWHEAYPHLDVEGECRKALVWVQADGTRRKTARGMSRFLVRWLNRAVDDRRPAAPSRSATTGAAPMGAYEAFACPHEPECHGRAACALKTQLNALKGNGGGL
jgi:hypothetical protein